jgi:hypothetical protein
MPESMIENAAWLCDHCDISSQSEAFRIVLSYGFQAMKRDLKRQRATAAQPEISVPQKPTGLARFVPTDILKAARWWGSQWAGTIATRDIVPGSP